MNNVWELAPWLAAMVILIGFSAFFSASEAALFYLRAPERRMLEDGSRTEQLAAKLLGEPERLLTAVLFWNLVINVAYFAISSIAAIRIERMENVSQSIPYTFAFGSLLTIIFFSEMLPKSVAVIRARWLASVVSIPLATFVRALDPVMPLLRAVNLLSRRLLWPGFKPEPYLEVSDLKKAIEISTDDAQLIKQEEAVLRNIVQLSDIRVDEWMRPRSQFISFRPPVSLADLEGRMTPSRYLLIMETDSEEIASALRLEGLSNPPQTHLEHLAEPVLYVPWCTTVADALEKMKLRDREVVSIVNEHGETIGILTFSDILDTVFNYAPSRSKLIFDHKPIHYISKEKWLVSGMTSLKRLSLELDIELPKTTNVTVSGVIQESLQRLANVGDQCQWGPFHFRVLELPYRGHMLVELTLQQEEIR